MDNIPVITFSTNYVAPSIDVIELEIEQSILVGSLMDMDKEPW